MLFSHRFTVCCDTIPRINAQEMSTTNRSANRSYVILSLYSVLQLLLCLAIVALTSRAWLHQEASGRS